MENRTRSKTDLDRNVPSIKINKKNTKPKMRSESARKVRHTVTSPETNEEKNSCRSSISNNEINTNQLQSPLFTPRAQPLSTRSAKCKKNQSVGFKPTEIRNKTDLIHNRFITEQLPVSQKPEPVLHTLSNMIKQIPTNEYEKSEPSTKLEILTKLLNAFNFAWNEVSIQVRELSEEHAIVLSQIKTFYSSLFTEYPRLLYSFDKESHDLKVLISEKDKQIRSLTRQIEENEDSISSIRGYIFGLQRELEETTVQRDLFEAELNNQVLEDDKLQTTLTDLRCTIRKQREGILRLYKIFDMVEAQPHILASTFINMRAQADLQLQKQASNDIKIEDQNENNISIAKTNSSLSTNDETENVSEQEKIETFDSVLKSEKFRNEFTKIVLENLKLDKKMTRIVNRKGNNELEEILDEDDDENEGNRNYKKTQNAILHDASVDTSDLQISLTEENRLPSHFLIEKSDFKNLSLKTVNLSLIKSEEAFTLGPIEPSEIIDKDHESLRRVILKFMKTPTEKADAKLMPDKTMEFKKFYWIYPKFMTIFTNGFSSENPEKPYKTFDDVVTCYFNNLYQTPYLASQMQQILINSVYLYEKMEPSVHLFYSFLTNEYDLNEFRFLNILLEYSLNSTEPLISSLMAKEMLTPEDTHIFIKRNKAREIYTALFPIGDVPKWLNDSINEPNIEYWGFVENCIKKFDDYRKHMWSVIKNGLLLSDCSDTNHITYKQFKNFFGISLPSLTLDEVKSIWNELTIRNKATGKRDDMLDFEALCYYITQKEEIFYEVMRRATPRNFAARYFDLNGSILEALSFIVKRLVYYIPTVNLQMKSNESMFKITCESIRECLFMCDIANAFAHYRMLLHLIDGIYVRDFGSLKLSSKSSDQEVKDFLQHFETRENAVGIFSLSQKKTKTKTT